MPAFSSAYTLIGVICNSIPNNNANTNAPIKFTYGNFANKIPATDQNKIIAVANQNDLVLIMFVNKTPSICDLFNLTNTTLFMMILISILLFSILDKVNC